MKTKYKFIFFEKSFHTINEKPFWDVKTNKAISTLGLVEWYHPWRQYCFSPFEGTIFNDTCLADIQHFIGQLKEGKP